jgi:hypothetical protein
MLATTHCLEACQWCCLGTVRRDAQHMLAKDHSETRRQVVWQHWHSSRQDSGVLCMECCQQTADPVTGCCLTANPAASAHAPDTSTHRRCRGLCCQSYTLLEWTLQALNLVREAANPESLATRSTGLQASTVGRLWHALRESSAQSCHSTRLREPAPSLAMPDTRSTA